MKEVLKEDYAMYCGDSINIMPQLKSESVDLITYSPPFASMYIFSGSDNDLSNCKNYDEFLEHYEFVVKETYRLLKPGRMVAIHCMDIPQNSDKGLIDFPGDIIRLHKNNGFKYWDRKHIWKDPLMVALRTRQRALIHGQLVKDSSKSRGGLADYILVFKKNGECATPIKKEFGLTEFYGGFDMLKENDQKKFIELQGKYRNWKDDKTNRLSQFIWYHYASSNWETIRPSEILEFKGGKEEKDQKHVTPTQLDAMKRIVVLYSNENEVVFSPFAGIGTEIYAALVLGRRGLGVELKESYFIQCIKNLESAKLEKEQQTIFDIMEN